MTSVGSAASAQFIPNQLAMHGEDGGGSFMDSQPVPSTPAKPKINAGPGYLGKSTSEWNNKALASLNQNFGRGSFKEGNRTATIKYIGGSPRLVVQNAAINGKNADISDQYINLVRNSDGTFRQQTGLDRMGAPGISN